MGLLDGKVALISGVGRGQGAAHALRLAEEGADIIGVDVVRDIDTIPYALSTPAELAATKDAVEALGRRFVAIEADVRDRELLAELVANAGEMLGRIDVVVAAAGVCSGELCWELSEEQWSDVVGSNLTGTWNLVTAALPIMIEGGVGGSIIFTGSHSGFMGLSYISHYAASKHGIVGLGKCAALDLAAHGIRVNVVHPTSVDTPMFDYWLDSEDTGESNDDKWTALNIMPIKSIQPVQVSEAVLFFASDQSRMISGSAMTMGQRGS